MLKAGQTLAHFKIIKRLGAGGMGEVYLAEDSKLGRKIALKILLADFFEDDERKERFYREAKTAAGISHPNVMGIHDIGRAVDPDSGQDLDYIVMEYIEGQSLSEYIRNNKLDIKNTIRLAEHIAAGLNAAHKVNVVHRDIKADNIIINEEGTSKILDFGLAKPVTTFESDKNGVEADTISQELTRTGKIIGTVSYMSPEQVRGETLDTRSDIFSFGILLYRMVTGKLPFEGETQVSTLAKILEVHQEPPRLINEQIPAELERIIDKCLKKDPNDRYQDTRDLVVDLRNLRRQYESGISGVTTGITDSSGITSRSSKSRSIWKSVVPAVAAVALIAIVFWQIMSGPGSDGVSSVQAGENALAILGFENKTGEDSLTWLQTGLPEILLTDLSQSQSLNIISRDRVLDCIKSEGNQETAAISHPEYLDAARTLGAKHALSGSYYRLGPNIRIDARVEEIATGRIILTEKVSGPDPFVLVDSLTKKIGQSLNLGDIETTKNSVRTYTSSSPEAFRNYLEGMRYFEKDLHDDAIVAFEKAITFDSTFALPYMRIGMIHAFEGRPQEGAHWFRKARQYQDRLPNREATMLDIYANLWLEQKFDDAFIKMELMVRNHPNDKETHYIYGLLLQVFSGDSVGAMAQMDTALQLDNQYLSVLTWYSTNYLGKDDYDKALEYATKARQFHPDSPGPYLILARIYTRQSKFSQAAEEYTAMLQKFPGHIDGLTRLATVYIHQRQFDKARDMADQIRQYHSDDNYEMTEYYDILANLANWNGQFKTSLDNRFKILESVTATGDSSLISGTFALISNIYQAYHMPDSAIYYSRLSYEWGTIFQKIDYPIVLAANSTRISDDDKALFDKLLDEFKSRLPRDLWPMADGIKRIFIGYVEADTAALIDGYMTAYRGNTGSGETIRRQAGYLAALSGRYQKAMEYLSPNIEGELMTSNGFAFPLIHYYLGMAEEGLGNPGRAKEHYQEMLKYWARPDMELLEIKDARARLARLTS